MNENKGSLLALSSVFLFLLFLIFRSPVILASDHINPEPVNTTDAPPFLPDCVYSNDPPMTGWNESFDSNDEQSYCLITNEVFHIQQDVERLSDGTYQTSGNPDLFKVINYSQKTGNIREVVIHVEFYEPFFPTEEGTEICLSHEEHSFSTVDDKFYVSPQLVLLANHKNGFSEESTFDDSFYFLNQELFPCGQWNTFAFTVKDFTNDFGSSFSGQSKDLGTFGLEMKNVYIRNITILGDGSEVVW